MRRASAPVCPSFGEEGSTAFYVLAHLLKAEYAGRLVITVDAVHRKTVFVRPHMLNGQSAPVLEGRDTLADNVGVLVLDPFGNLMPVSYGFARPLWIGNLADDLGRQCQAYLAEGGGVHNLYALGRRTLDKVARGHGADVFNPRICCREPHIRG